MYTLTEAFRTKTEAKAALKAGITLGIIRHDGLVLRSANGGPFPITEKLDHYKAWKGGAYVIDGRVYRIQ